MTLILGMSKPEGIYLSADFRVTDGGRLVDDASVKLIDILFPPMGGTRALLAYTGLAVLPGDGTPLGAWLVETLRGESEVPDQAMAHLRDRLDRDVAPYLRALILNILLIEGEHGERRLFGGFANVNLATPGAPVMNRFQYQMAEVTDRFVFVNGSGAAKVIADGQFELMKRQLMVRPRRALDHMKLLASINRRVAESVKTVSPACHVAFVPVEPHKPDTPPDRLFGAMSQSFTEHGEDAPAVMPVVLFGIDTSIMMRQLHEQMAALRQGHEPPPEVPIEEMRRLFGRRP